MDDVFSLLTVAAAAKFKDPRVAYLVEGTNANPEEASHSIVLHGMELDFNASVCDGKAFNNSSRESSEQALACSFFCSKHKSISSSASREVCQILEAMLTC